VSVEAISWALNLAPVPADRGGQPSSACKFVLVGLANHAGPDGTGAFPSVATLVRYTGLSERTVRTLPGPAGGRGHHLAVRPGHRGGPDQADRPPPAGLGLEPEPGPPPSANCVNPIRVTAGERCRTGVNETETETGGWAARYGAARLRSGAP
jgi:Helix-turn-helix domain